MPVRLCSGAENYYHSTYICFFPQNLSLFNEKYRLSANYGLVLEFHVLLSLHFAALSSTFKVLSPPWVCEILVHLQVLFLMVCARIACSPALSAGLLQVSG